MFCGSSEGNDSIIINEASVLGKTLAARNIALIYGAAKIGIMGVVSKAVKENGGEVIGVVPHFLSCLLYTSPSPRDQRGSRMPSSA